MIFQNPAIHNIYLELQSIQVKTGCEKLPIIMVSLKKIDSRKSNINIKFSASTNLRHDTRRTSEQKKIPGVVSKTHIQIEKNINRDRHTSMEWEDI